MSVLSLHMNWLSETTDDALRVLKGAGRPAYVLDYEVLHAYAFARASEPSTASSVAYLLQHSDVRSWIGPGTALEIIRTVNRVVQDATAARLLKDLAAGERFELDRLTGEYERIRRRIQRVSRRGISSHRGEDMFGIYLLIDLLVSYEIDLLEVDVDVDSVNALSVSLDALRPRRTENNFADALNYATVLAARARPPYETASSVVWLLTNSQPLFNERLLSSAHSPMAISRDVLTAVYSAIAFEHSSGAQELASRALQQSELAAELRSKIIRSALESGDEGSLSELELAQAVSADRVTPMVREALRQLADLVSDPIVLHAQEIFDDYHVVATNIAKQRGLYELAVGSDARMMEFLYDLGQVIARGVTALSDLWHVAMDVEDDQVGHIARREVFMRGPRTTGDPVFVIERHEGDHPMYVFNWPGGRDANLVLRSMSNAFIDRGVYEVTAMFGFGDEDDPEVWRLELPLTSEDLQGLSPSRGVVWWVRLQRPGLFGLFTDLVVDDVTATPLTVGLVSAHPDPNLVVDLQSHTASRFILAEWLVRVMEDFGIRIEEHRGQVS